MMDGNGPIEPPPIQIPKSEIVPALQDRCWRCGILVPSTDAVCSRCQAPLSAKMVSPVTLTKNDNDPVVKNVAIAFGLFLLTSVLQGMILSSGRGIFDPGLPPSAYETWVAIGFVEIVDTIIVLATGLIVYRQLQPAPASWPGPIVAWCLMIPMLFVTLAVNIGYHHLLRTITLTPMVFDVVTQDFANWHRWIWVICIQPAIVEELFFRSLLFRALRPYLNVHLTVFVTAVAFGMAHIGAPLSIPFLAAAGVTFGYLRAWTGSIWLSVVAHFLHNLAVSYIDWYMWQSS